MKIDKILFTLYVSIAFSSPVITNAADINYNRLLDDQDIFTLKMSKQHIQRFLDAQGALGGYKEEVNDVTKNAADVIYEAQQLYDISAQYLLTTIQKESSLITTQTLDGKDRLLSWATGYAVCDSCSKDDPDIQEYKGFANQVTWAAKQNRRYADYPESYKYKVNGNYTVDDIAVTVENQATANMYSYTPHLHGNQLAVSLFRGWFVQPLHPQGTLVTVEGEKGGVYLVGPNNTLQPFTSRTAFSSNNSYADVITISPAEKLRFDVGAPIKFASGSLIRTPEGNIYLVRGTTLHRILSPEVFATLGFNYEEIQHVEVQDVLAYDFGEPIDENDIHPSGALLQSKETGGVWYIEAGTRYAIPDRIYLRQYPYLRVKPATEEELATYADGGKRKLKDGTLVTAPSYTSVYVISNGMKRPFDSKETFDALGYQWKNIITVSDLTLRDDVHQTGDFITISAVSD